MGLLASWLASITDARLFPAERRSGALGFCNLIAQSVTCFSSLVNEVEEPTPIVVFVICIGIAMLNTVTFELPPESPAIRE